ncbi:MAG: DNA recombination protein RmuC [Acidobacteria bacterium]|nr:DNA recombination protein RmuC [Acidobacteriota bacterium]MBP8272825.1 DNA recombination protein RmuC [Acidobacteriota bacterium]
MSSALLFLIVGALAGAGLGAIVATWLANRTNTASQTQMQLQMRDAFAALSRDALRETNTSLLETADHTLRARQDAIDEMLKPVRETLDKVQAQVVRADRDREGSFRAVKEQLTSLAQSQEQLRLTADVLSRSLRSPNTRGKWGEIQLKRIVELAGMLEHCDFEQQELGDDSRLKPDMTVRLPGGTRIVVDSKVPIEAYMRAVESQQDDARNKFLDDHAAQVKQHVRALGNKKYWEQFKGPGPEFVVMFLPLEPLMSAAFERDGELLEFAARENVVLATPMTLLALLRAVAFGWQQQSLARNAEEIREVGQELCDRLATMLKHFDDTGDHLAGAVEAFNRAVASFDRRVMPSMRRLQELKVPGAEKVEAPEARPAVIKSFGSQMLLELPDSDSDDAPDGTRAPVTADRR